MLNVTEKAQKEVAKFFEENEKKPIRIFITQGCGGPQVAMAIDEEKKDDKAFEFDSITYLVEEGLIDEIKPVQVDFNENGFQIDSSLQSAGCSGCGEHGCG
ncbi:MAG: adhesin [Deltaproteobacteria bacterium]|nr:adhesin [Deltaproteobacteria bacterium]